jgi:CxxC-x17-CxxC domain-containing protein
MYNATCAECGRSCEVPFQPNFDKPVYCSECFQTKRRGEDGGRSDYGDRGGDRRSDRGSRDERRSAPDNSGKQFESLNTKLDKIISLLSQNSIKREEKESVTVKSEEKKAEKPLKKAVAKKEVKVAKKASVKKVAKKSKK